MEEFGMKINLEKLALPSKTAEFAFPGIKGFKVKLNVLSRTTIRKLQEKCMFEKEDEASGLTYKDIDMEKYQEEYAKATIVGWSGLTLKKVASLILIDESQVDNPDAEIDYDLETAIFLVKNSQAFDSWVTERLNKIDNFRN